MAEIEVDPEENFRRMQAGEHYYAFAAHLIEARKRAARAIALFNKADDISRRDELELLRDILEDDNPLPRRHLTMSDEEDAAQLSEHPVVCPPLRMDYGYNVKIAKGVFINSNSTWIDTCDISVGARTIIGPNCSFYSGIHPLDPTVRNGLKGPESGKPITIGEDCWIAGNVIILQGVTIGKGSTIGAGSVVSRDIPPYHLAVGNPARVVRKIEVAGAGEGQAPAGEEAGEEVPAE